MMPLRALAEFVLARVAEDEAAVVSGGECYCDFEVDRAQRPDCADRIARECEATRLIVERALEARDAADVMRETFCGDTSPRTQLARARAIATEWAWIEALTIIARPHSDHPDYPEAQS